MIRLFNHYLSVRVMALSAVEALVLGLALYTGYQLRLDYPQGPAPLLESAVFAGVLVVSMSAAGMYQSLILPLRPMLQRLLVAYLAGLIFISVVFYVFQEVYVGRGVLLYATAIGLVGVVLVRVAFVQLIGVEILNRRLMLIGTDEEINRFIGEHRDRRFSDAIKVCAVYRVGSPGAESGSPQPDHNRLLQIVRQERIAEIVITSRERRGGVLPLRQLLDCKLTGVQVVDMVSFCERETGSLPLDDLRASWLIAGSGFEVGRWRDAVKRGFDIVVSLATLIATSPIMLVAAAAVLIESGRPVLYRQERVGEGGRIFTILKLRSMIRNAESDGRARWAIANDSRVTPVGRFLRRSRIDELPQLFNVLRGDMSFVGPRPERPEFVEQLTEKIPFYAVRHSIKPGITGWAQVRFIYTSSLQDTMTKLQFDLYYVKNHSILLDLLILIQTLEVIVLRKGAV